mgnify:CR=1 FL=1
MNEADIQVTLSGVVSFLILIIAISSIWRGIKVVPQSEEYTIERFGKYTKTLNAGLNFIVPFLDQISRRISILERQLPEFTISVITKDNVEVKLKATVFYRVVDAAKSVYRIQDVDLAIDTEATSIVRSAADRKSTRLNSSHPSRSRMPSSA